MVVETATGRRLVSGKRLENSPDVLVFSPDGRKLAGVITAHDADARTARPRHAWADGSPALGKALHVWDAETGREIRVIPGSFEAHQSPAFSPDGTRVAAALLTRGRHSLRDFDLRLMPWGDGNGVPTSGNALVIVGNDGDDRVHVRIFDQDGHRVTDTDETKLPPAQSLPILALKRRVPVLLPPHVMTALERSRTLEVVASIVFQYPLRDVKVWELDSGREVVSFPMAASTERSSLWLGFSPDGGALATVATNPAGDVLQVWDIATRRSRFAIPLEYLSQTTDYCLQAAFSPDGRPDCLRPELAPGGCLGHHRRQANWPSTRGTGSRWHSAGTAGTCWRPVYSGAVKVWDTADNPSARILSGEGPVSGPAVSPDARRIACIANPTGSPPVVKVWDASGRPLRSLPRRSTAPNRSNPSSDSVVWSARGDRLAYVTNPHDLMRRNSPRRQEKAAGGPPSGIWTARSC